jgi:hypothetical protein
MNDSTMRVLQNVDTVWIDNAWLDTVVVVGVTAFILCLKGLSQVRTVYM